MDNTLSQQKNIVIVKYVHVHGKTSIHIIAKVNIQLSCSMITGKTISCF